MDTHRSGHPEFGKVVGLTILALLWSQPLTSLAQVTTAISADGTMGTVVNQIGNLHDITGGSRPGNGPNLFHSFGQFSVGGGDIANFRNNAGLPTENILSRVTGGNPSNIFGTIQTQGFGNANLFLMNPAGIVFGPDASLNVGGATHFTTADYLRLSDDVQFTALPSAQDALLTVAPVAAFGFLKSNPASLSVQGSTLSVLEGQTLSLVGGDITIGSGLNAPGGQIALASVASPGEVLADTYASGPNANGQSFTAMGNISLVEGATLDVSGDVAGTVVIRGGRLMVDGSTISANTMGPADGQLEPPGAGIDIQVTGDLLMDNGAFIQANVLEGSIAGRDIMLNVGQNLEVRNASMVQTQALGGSGNAGNIEINANRVLISDNLQGALLSVTFGAFFGNSTGNAGNINITTKDLQMVNAVISAPTVFGTGQGGRVDVNVRGGEMFLDAGVISTNTFGSSGNAGQVQITADKLTLTNNSNIESNVSGDATGKAGSVNVVVNGQLDIRERSAISLRSDNTGADGDLTITAEDIIITGIREGMFPLFGQGDFTGLSTRTSDGQGADMHITARNLQVTDNGFINGSTAGSGSSGNILINLSEGLRIADGGEIMAISTGSGAAGQIEVVADTVELSGKNAFPFIGTDGADALAFARISTQTDASGTGGTIGISARQISLLDGGSVTSSSLGEGDGGTIRLSADTISISGENPEKTAFGFDPRSSITTENEGRIPGPEATGRAGTIDIQAGTFELSQGLISARTSSAGEGGSIRVVVGQLSLTEGAEINSGTTGTGAGGAITIEASDNILITGTLDGTRSGVLSRTTGRVPGAGAGGTISLIADQDFTLSDGATVSASSDGPGNAGNITLTANDTILIDKATVATDATLASGGNIKLTANDTIQLVDSTIESSVQGDVTTVGGDISLDPDFIILQNSRILAKAVQGQGGNISLMANEAVLVDPFSVLDASSALGISGSVNIQAPIQNLSGTIAPLPQDPVPVTALYGSRCVAGADGHFSTFVDSKTDSLAPSPGKFLASPFLPLVNSSNPGAFSHVEPSFGVSQTSHAVQLQISSYSPSLLFTQSTGVLSACP